MTIVPSTRLSLLSAIAVATIMSLAGPTEADAGYRQYYSGWSYHPQRSYHYRTYYYKPAVRSTTYSYHYCVYRPSTPRYVYYYNPHTSRYWGRYDLEGKPGQEYSILAEKDQKSDLDAIPESAFPAPAAMPKVPDAEDGVTVQPPPGGAPTTDDSAPDLP